MKAIGLTRELDGLGRILIPKDLLNGMGLGGNDEVEIVPTDEGLLVRAITGRCVACGETEQKLLHETDKGFVICRACRQSVVRGIRSGDSL